MPDVSRKELTPGRPLPDSHHDSCSNLPNRNACCLPQPSRGPIGHPYHPMWEYSRADLRSGVLSRPLKRLPPQLFASGTEPASRSIESESLPFGHLRLHDNTSVNHDYSGEIIG